MKTNLLKAAIFTPTRKGWGLPTLLWGLPGVAKSDILSWLAAEYRMPIEVLSPACRGEGAFGVTPVPADNRMTYPRPDWTDKFEKAGRGIVFVDEMNLAANHYAGALLGLLQDRVLGSYKLPPGVRILAAANPIDIAAASGGWDLSAPAANRVGHLDWPSPDVKTWTEWLLADDLTESVGKDPAEEERRVVSLWPEAWGMARGVAAGFLMANASHLHMMPQGGSAATSKAYPTPRSWENATRALASAKVHGLSDSERDEFVGCFIGDGAAGELFTWLAKANLPDSARLLDGLVKWTHKPSRLDVTMAVFSSAVALTASTTETTLRKRRSVAMWNLLSQAVDNAPDLIVSPARTMIKAKLFDGIIGKVNNKLTSILDAAGVQVRSE